MSIDRRLLAVIGRRYPAVYDVIPRGSLSRFSEAALNPQPLPPLPPDELGAAIATEFIRTVWFEERSSRDPIQSLIYLDDWCPTRPKWPRLPWWKPTPEPPPRPEWLVDFHLGFAAQVSAILPEFEGTQFGAVLTKAADRSVEAAESFVAN